MEQEPEQDHMLQEEPPSYSLSQSHDPQYPQHPPSVPSTDPSTIHHDRRLPPLPPAPALAEPRSQPEPEEQFTWPSSNPLTAYYQPGPAQLSPKNTSGVGMESPTPMDVGTPDSRGRRGGSVLSIDDPDVRLAAEALGDLRADFVQSPPHRHNSLPSTSPHNSRSRWAQQSEPLLSLLTTSHPLIGTAIGGSLSAYSASKNYSPRFKSGAEYVEKRFTPVVNTVGSMGRLTGVEGGVRWFLGGRRPSHHLPSDAEGSGESSNKRRKVETDTQETGRNASRDPNHPQELQHRQRAPSHSSTADSLPAYDDYKSPSYEDAERALVPTQLQGEVRGLGGSWQSRLVLSTSGLSVAMSEDSLRSLKYCLSWLSWANEHIGKVILALKAALQQYDESPVPDNSGAIMNSDEEGEPQKQLVAKSEAERSALNAKVAELKGDVLKTLKEVVDVVSKYAGGALPDNARELVKRHLTSLPQRFRLANSRSGEASNTEQGDAEVEGANRVLVLAREGLDMMAQVSGVLDGTITSAEEWCERLGKKKREEAEGEMDSSRAATKLEKPPPHLPKIDGQENMDSGRSPDVNMG